MYGEVHNRRLMLALLGAGLLAPAAARATTPETADEALQAALDQDQRLTTPVWIDGQGPYAFVVDTGSNHTIIADDLARGLALPQTGQVMVNTVAGAEKTASVSTRALGIGRPQGRATQMGVASRASIGGDGLLGIDQLDNLRLSLNFRDRRLAVGASGRRIGDMNAFKVKARQQSGQLTLVGAEVAGLPVTAFVDSGSEATIGNLALRQAVAEQVRRAAEAAGEAPVQGATGLVIPGQEGYLPNLKVGGLRIRALPVVYADLHTFRFWGMAEAPALILGVDLLRRFEMVDLDFGRGEVLFRVEGSSPVGAGSRIRGLPSASGKSIRGGGRG